MLAKSAAVLALCCLAAVQAGTISRKGVVDSRDSVRVQANNGVAVKSGYEGYVYPTSLLAEDRKDSGWLSSSQLDVLKAVIMYKSSFLPIIGVKIVKILLHFVVALFIGIASTTAVCSFTPLCSISFEGSKPAFLAEKDLLPLLKEALEVVSRMPNFLKRDQPPAQPQPKQPLGVAESTAEESSEQIVDPRGLRKNLDDDAGQSSRTEPANVEENEA